MTIPVLTAAQMKAVEALTTSKYGISEQEMIMQAGMAVFLQAQITAQSLKNNRGSWVIICGKGHNGADGLQAALFAEDTGIPIHLYQISSSKGYSKETRALQQQIKAKPNLSLNFISNIEDFFIPDTTSVIIEGLLGAGITREPEGLIRQCIERLNQTNIPVISIDIPSGLPTDITRALIHVKAHTTISLGSPKLSSFFNPAMSAYGHTCFNPICFKTKDIQAAGSGISAFTRADALAVYPRRPVNANKYTAGKVLIIAGSAGMHGAAIMASGSALRAGAGLVRLAVPSALGDIAAAHTTEVITMPIGKSALSASCFDLSHIPQLEPWLEWADSILIGPGLGKAPQTMEFLNKILPAIHKPLIIDGDGLQYFCSNTQGDFTNTILTPHEGEYKRMGGICPSSPLERITHLQELSQKLRTNILLKGPTSILGTTDGNALILTPGNPGLATAGTGDVLAGILSALRCHLGPSQAGGLACYIHSRAAAGAVQKNGTLGMIASDVIKLIGPVTRELELDLGL